MGKKRGRAGTCSFRRQVEEEGRPGGLWCLFLSFNIQMLLHSSRHEGVFEGVSGEWARPGPRMGLGRVLSMGQTLVSSSCSCMSNDSLLIHRKKM